MSLYEDKTCKPGQASALSLEEMDQLRSRLIVNLRNNAPEALWHIQSHAARVRAAIRDIVSQSMPQLSHQEARNVESDLMDDIYGWGPISELMRDDLVTDIWVVRYDHIKYEKLGEKHEWPKKFLSEEHLRRVAVRMAAAFGRSVDEAHPLEDCRLPDGSRVSIILNGVSQEGTTVTIRRFGKFFELEDLAERNMFPSGMIEVLHAMVVERQNILIVGGFGCGKNTLMNALLARVPHEESIILIEDPAESNLLHEALRGAPELRQRLPKDIRHLEPRHSNIEGGGAVTIDQLFRAALKMKPTRVGIAEITDPKTAYYALMAMNLSQPGSMTTGHATGAQGGLKKLDTFLAAYPEGAFADLAVRADLIAGVDIVIHLQQLKGHRFVQEIAGVRQQRPGEFPAALPLYLDEGSGLRRVGFGG